MHVPALISLCKDARRRRSGDTKDGAELAESLGNLIAAVEIGAKRATDATHAAASV